MIFVPHHCVQFNCGFPPQLHLLRNKHDPYQTKLSLQSFQCAFTMGPEHKPSPSKGRGNTHNSKFGSQCGAHGMWILCYLWSVTWFPSKPSITISWYRVAVWHLTSKVEWNLCYLTEIKCVSGWHLACAWLPNFWQQSAVTLCLFRMNSVHVYHMYKMCLCFAEGRILPKLPLRDIEVHGDWSRVFPKGMKVRGWPSKMDPFSMEETHSRRTEIPRHERGCPRHPWGPRQIWS